MSVEVFLKQRAVNIAVSGSYSLERRWYDAEGKLRTFECRTTRVSPFRMLVEVPVVGQVGERLTSYFREFGEFEGVITHTTKNSFLVKMEMAPEHRARLAGKLAWLEKKFADATVEDAREHARIVPPTSRSVLTLADGSVLSCAIIDISPSGVAVLADTRPPLGTPLAIGACVGRVVRHFDNGVAIRFVERQSIDDLSRLIIVQPRRRPISPAEDLAGGAVEPELAEQEVA